MGADETAAETAVEIVGGAGLQLAIHTYQTRSTFAVARAVEGRETGVSEKDVSVGSVQLA